MLKGYLVRERLGTPGVCYSLGPINLDLWSKDTKTQFLKVTAKQMSSLKSVFARYIFLLVHYSTNFPDNSSRYTALLLYLQIFCLFSSCRTVISVQRFLSCVPWLASRFFWQRLFSLVEVWFKSAGELSLLVLQWASILLLRACMK